MVTLERSFVVSPSVSMKMQGTGLYIRNPNYQYNVGAYTKVFRWEVWMVAGFFCLLCSILMYMVTQ